MQDTASTTVRVESILPHCTDRTEGLWSRGMGSQTLANAVALLIIAIHSARLDPPAQQISSAAYDSERLLSYRQRLLSKARNASPGRVIIAHPRDSRPHSERTVEVLSRRKKTQTQPHKSQLRRRVQGGTSASEKSRKYIKKAKIQLVRAVSMLEQQPLLFFDTEGAGIAQHRRLLQVFSNADLSVAIVGNAPMTQCQFADIIDAHNIVVRLNFYALDRFRGWKTSIHIACLPHLVYSSKLVLNSSALRISMECHHFEDNFADNRTWSTLKPSILRELCTTESTRGFYAVLVLSHFFRHVDLYGFEGSLGYDWRSQSWGNIAGNHDFWAEHATIDSMSNVKRHVCGRRAHEHAIPAPDRPNWPSAHEQKMQERKEKALVTRTQDL